VKRRIVAIKTVEANRKTLFNSKNAVNNTISPLTNNAFHLQKINKQREEEQKRIMEEQKTLEEKRQLRR
jgi:hypothetical protein